MAFFCHTSKEVLSKVALNKLMFVIFRNIIHVFLLGAEFMHLVSQHPVY